MAGVNPSTGSRLASILRRLGVFFAKPKTSWPVGSTLTPQQLSEFRVAWGSAFDGKKLAHPLVFSQADSTESVSAADLQNEMRELRDDLRALRNRIDSTERNGSAMVIRTADLLSGTAK